MAQPMGTLISISTKDGKTISEAKKYFNSNVLIFDPGFGTFDIFDIKNRVISNYYSFSDLSMKQILIDTCDEIYNTYKTEISVAAMQKYLKDGKIKVSGVTPICLAADNKDSCVMV
jgi:plasmid segregation protein ParM